MGGVVVEKTPINENAEKPQKDVISNPALAGERSFYRRKARFLPSVEMTEKDFFSVLINWHATG